jgi:hypothetical protein
MSSRRLLVPPYTQAKSIPLFATRYSLYQET